MIQRVRTWLCLLLPWHRLSVKRVFSSESRMVQCSCGRKYAMNDRVKAFLSWDKDFDKLYYGEEK